METGFLEVLKKSGRDDVYEGDQFGGASGGMGTGLPMGGRDSFLFATGIECSYPKIAGNTIRRDMLAECGHYKRYREDLGLVKEMGLKVVRYGLPYYSIHTAPGKYDWSFADDAMQEVRRLGLTPILDLLHFGVPDWIGDFQNPELPMLFAEYAGEVAKRYPWVRFYTPVNEIFVTAKFSGKEGGWNEARRDDKSFVTAMKNCVAASILANHAIAKERPDCMIVQSESAEYVHEARAEPSAETCLLNKLRFLSLDLLYAHPIDSDVCMYLADNGLTRAEFDWFMVGEPPGYQIMGNDYYGRNERIVLPDGQMLESEDVLGWYNITRTYYERYRKPVMHTETNTFDAERNVVWLWKQWINILRMRQDGVPVLGFTWYSLIDQIDWDTGLTEKNNRVNACGLYDLERRPRPVAEAYRQLLQEFGRIAVVPHGDMFTLTDKPASLKVVV